MRLYLWAHRVTTVLGRKMDRWLELRPSERCYWSPAAAVLFPVRLWVLASRPSSEVGLQVWAWAPDIHVEIICLPRTFARHWWPNFGPNSRDSSEPFLFKGKKSMEKKCHTNLSLIMSKSALWNILFVILNGQTEWMAVGFACPASIASFG